MKNYKNYRYEDIKEKMTNNNLLRPLDILVIGATGGGKSSSINTFLGSNEANIGYGVDPKTIELNSYNLNDWFRLWDSPGLGDTVDLDLEHSRKIENKLTKIVENPSYKNIGFIDMVLIVLEGGTRDIGTVLNLIKKNVLPNIEKERIVVGINQADFAMKGKNFDYEKNSPNEKLKEFLEEKLISTQNRIKEIQNINVPVVYYSAETGYNVDKLLDTLISNIPRNKREIKN